VDNIQSAWVKAFNAEVKDRKVPSFRVNLKITFLIGDRGFFRRDHNGDPRTAWVRVSIPPSHPRPFR